MISTSDIQAAYRKVRSALLAERAAEGYWPGHLSSSALAAATAISALCCYRNASAKPILPRSRLDTMIDKGVSWLMREQNGDGGWGDTESSHSNISSTMLVIAAVHLADRCENFEGPLQRAGRYVQEQGHIEGLKQRYGRDKTFAVPILANCAIAGIVDWQQVAALPCEAAVVPQRWYRWLQLPVVSYAIPALVATGQAKLVADPPRNPLIRWVRRASMRRGMRVLQRMQPASGGYLEAIPLTSFVVMALCDSGRADHSVAENGVRFISETFREMEAYGTWPIDTNLATWNTTLAVNALCDLDLATSTDPDDDIALPDQVLNDDLLTWLLSCQHSTPHPFTGAAPGGWGWSDLSGAVPDADDTPGALLALRRWYTNESVSEHVRSDIRRAAELGLGWLLDLQNRDSGWPTFCRGWGRLPFDRSGADITAHVLRSLVAWQGDFDDNRTRKAISRGFDFLTRQQHPSGAWSALWFGNQDVSGEENFVYGTAKVLLAYMDAGRFDTLEAEQGLTWLIENQNSDGGWGGGESYANSAGASSSVQETSLALEVLAGESAARVGSEAFLRGSEWLVSAINDAKYREPWPIGFYFAKLWYYERLYPLIFSVSAMRRIAQAMQRQADRGGKTPASTATSQAHNRGISIGG